MTASPRAVGGSHRALISSLAVPPEDLAGEPRELHPVGAAEVAAGDLLHGDAEGEEVGLLAAIGGRRPEAQEPQLPHLAPGVPGELAAPVPVGRARRSSFRAKARRVRTSSSCSGVNARVHGALRRSVQRAPPPPHRSDERGRASRSSRTRRSRRRAAAQPQRPTPVPPGPASHHRPPLTRRLPGDEARGVGGETAPRGTSSGLPMRRSG